MSPKAAIGALAAVCVGLGLARTESVPAAAQGGKKVEISFWNGFTGPDGRTMLQIIRDFNRENPDVHVTMQRMEWATYYNKLMVAAVDGRGPELFVIHSSTLPRMVRAGFVADAKNLYGPNLPAEDFDPVVIRQLQFGDKVVGVPLDIHPQGMYVNLDMMREIGLDGPPKNREEFVRAAESLKEDLDGDKQTDRWGLALTMWRNNFLALVPQFGGRCIDENGNPTLDDPRNIAALEFLASLTKDKLVPPPENGLGWVGYRQKKVGMVWDGVYMLGDLKRLQDLNYAAAPIPQIGPQPGTMADSHVLCIKEGLPPNKREGVERFVKYLSANSIRWADAGQVPARISVRETPEFKAMPVQSVFAQQIPYMLYPPRTPVLFEFTGEIDLAVEKAIRGRATAAEALKAANESAKRVFARDKAQHGGTP